MKKLILSLFASIILLGCSSTKTEETSKAETEEVTEVRTYKLGVNGTDHTIWDGVRERLKEKGIEIEYVEFTDYVQPNIALSDGEIDLNAFQTVIYFENFIKENNITNLTHIGYTQVAPMGIYSKKYATKDEIPTDKKLIIAIPNDTTNGGRAIKFLEQLGYIKVDPSVGNIPKVVDITEYIVELEIVEMVATQIPASLPDLDFAVINNGVAYQAGLTIAKDALAYEDYKAEGMENYWNIIAVKTEDATKEDFLTIVKEYQTDETKKAIEEYYGGQSIPVWE